MPLSKFGELLDKMLDHPEHWRAVRISNKILLWYKATDAYAEYKDPNNEQYSPHYASANYCWWHDPIISLNVTEKYLFDTSQRATMTVEDKEATWEKAKKIRDSQIELPVRVGDFDMPCLEATRSKNQKAMFKKVLKAVMEIPDND